MIIAIRVNDDLKTRLTNLARDLNLPRTALCRHLLTGALRNTKQIDAWKDAVLGPRFAFMESTKPRRRRTPKLPLATPKVAAAQS